MASFFLLSIENCEMLVKLLLLYLRRDINGPQFNGTLPAELSKLSKLTYLYLSFVFSCSPFFWTDGMLIFILSQSTMECHVRIAPRGNSP